MRNPSSPIRVVVVVVAGLAVASCGSDEAPPEPGFRVRLLTSVALSGRWERQAERGLGRIAAELGADVARSRATGLSDLRTRLRSQAADGIDLIFCVGPDVESVVYTEAVAFPDSVFVMIPGDIHAANVGSIAFLPEEVGFLAGTAAASLTEVPRVGLLRGAGRPWLERLEAGFSDGFRSRHPGAEVITTRGPEGPWQLTEQGVGIALYSTDLAEAPVLAAAHDAGLLLVATDPQVMELEGDVVVAAIDVDVAEAMLRVALEVRDRRFTGQVFAFDLGSGVLDVELNPDLENERGWEGVRESLERARSEITAGWVEIEELGIGRTANRGGAH